MAGKEENGGKGKVPPRPGASRPSVPKRPTAKAGGFGTGKPGPITRRVLAEFRKRVLVEGTRI